MIDKATMASGSGRTHISVSQSDFNMFRRIANPDKVDFKASHPPIRVPSATTNTLPFMDLNEEAPHEEAEPPRSAMGYPEDAEVGESASVALSHTTRSHHSRAHEYSLAAEERRVQKLTIMAKLRRLAVQGFPPSREYTEHDDLDLMRTELGLLETQLRILDTRDSLKDKVWRGVRYIENGNALLGLKLPLRGLHAEACSDMGRYNQVLTRIAEDIDARRKPKNPYMQLMWMIGGSAVSTVVNNIAGARGGGGGMAPPPEYGPYAERDEPQPETEPRPRRGGGGVLEAIGSVLGGGGHRQRRVNAPVQRPPVVSPLDAAFDESPPVVMYSGGAPFRVADKLTPSSSGVEVEQLPAAPTTPPAGEAHPYEVPDKQADEEVERLLTEVAALETHG